MKRAWTDLDRKVKAAGIIVLGAPFIAWIIQTLGVDIDIKPLNMLFTGALVWLGAYFTTGSPPQGTVVVPSDDAPPGLH